MQLRKKFIIGIDSGGTNLRVQVLFPFYKKIINKNFKSIPLITKGVKDYSYFVSGLLYKLLSGYNLKLCNCIGVCFAIAGARNNKIKKEIKRTLHDYLRIKNIIVFSDAEASLIAAFKGQDGVILIGGTGSVIYAKYKNKLIRTGGWGRLIGDAGSGYEIGKNILQKLVYEYDLFKGTARSKYLKDIEKKFKINNENLIDKIYLRNFDIASLAQFAIKLADKGNKKCKELLKQEAKRLIKQLDIFAKSNEIKDKLNLAVTGGLLENKNFYSELIKQQIRSKLSRNFNLIEKKIIPVEGATYIAFKKFVKEKVK